MLKIKGEMVSYKTENEKWIINNFDKIKSISPKCKQKLILNLCSIQYDDI